MFNLKIGGIIAGTAFILSFLIGLVSRSSMPMLLLRPLIFAVLFFIITNFVYHLVTRFLPELLEEGGADEDMFPPGSRVNITEDGSPPASVQAFFGAQADDSDEGLDDIADLAGRSSFPQTAGGGTSAGMDQNAQNGYNTGEKPGTFSGAGSLEPEELSPDGGSPDSGMEAFPNSVDILPDLDSMAGAFFPSSGDAEEDTTEYSVSAPVRKPSSGGKSPDWAGDFNAKEMAAGLRTILNKEKEG